MAFTAALRQLPLRAALQRFAVALRPGGLLAAIARPHRELARELPVELATDGVYETCVPGAGWLGSAAAAV